MLLLDSDDDILLFESSAKKQCHSYQQVKRTHSKTRNNGVRRQVIIVLLFLFISSSILYLLMTSEPYDSIAMSWSDCSDSKTRGAVTTYLKLNPAPVLMPGNVSIGINMKLTRPLVPKAKLSLRIMKKVLLLWFDVPCVDDVGSCDYDLCQLWPVFNSCPAAFLNNSIPCNCPFAKGSYSIPDDELQVQVSSSDVLPVWMETGAYWAQITVYDEQETVFLCNQMYVRLVAD